MKRAVINKVLILSGGLTALSGIFLFFHYESSFIKAIHEIGALTLLVFCLLHLKMNWNALAKAAGGKKFALFALCVFAAYAAVMAATGTLYDEETMLNLLRERLEARENPA